MHDLFEALIARNYRPAEVESLARMASDDAFHAIIIRSYSRHEVRRLYLSAIMPALWDLHASPNGRAFWDLWFHSVLDRSLALQAYWDYLALRLPRGPAR